MFGNKEGKPVDIFITAHTYIDGELQEEGTVLKQVPAELAMHLAADGKARVATKADIAAAAKKALAPAPAPAP